MAIVGTLLRRAAMLRMLPLATIVAYLFANDRPESWSDYWVASSAHTAEATVFLGPLVAGAAAWDAKRFQRAGTAELLEVAARPSAVRVLSDAGAAVVWALPAYLVVLAVQWVQMTPATVGWPSLPLLTIGFGVVATLGLFGTVAGTFLPRFLGPAIVAIAAYLWLIFPPSWNSEVAGHFSVSRSACCPIDVVIDPDLMWAQALYLAAICCLLLVPVLAVTPWVPRVSAPRLVSTRLPLAPLVVGLALGALSMPAMLEPNRDGYSARTPPANPSCAGSDPEVCVWPEKSEDLETLAQAAAELAVATRAAGGSVPPRFADPGLFPGDDQTKVVAPQGDGEPFDHFVARFARYLLPEVPACAYLEDGQSIAYPGLDVEPLMVAYLTDRAGHPETARLVAGELLTPFLDATVAAPAEAQQAWFATNLQVMSTCDHEPLLAPA